jgi:hypothetical protein
MPRALFILGLPSIVVLLQGCSVSNPSSQQVQEIGAGTYSVGVGKGYALMDSSKSHDALDVALGKAGDYCHAKGQKLAVTSSVGNNITFRCASDAPPKPK